MWCLISTKTAIVNDEIFPILCGDIVQYIRASQIHINLSELMGILPIYVKVFWSIPTF